MAILRVVTQNTHVRPYIARARRSVANIAVLSNGCCYGRQVQAKFKKAGLRVAVDRGSERLAKQIRTAEKASVGRCDARQGWPRGWGIRQLETRR